MSLDIEPQTTTQTPEVGLPDFANVALYELTATRNLKLTEDHPRRLLQISDAATANYLFERFGKAGPRPVGVRELWQALEAPRPFEPLDWPQLQRYFGTREMYADPEHQLCIHGDGHQDRVTLYSAILGQYKGLTESEMKVLLVAASVHDRARVNDRVDQDHGKRAGYNFTLGDPENTIEPYLKTYLERGMNFTEKELMQIQLLCIYHEMPWDSVVQFEDNRTNLLIQTLQAADAADRYRSPNPEQEVGWWPKPEFFMNFFEGDRTKVDAFLAFTAYFTLSSEKERFNKYDDPQAHVEDAIRSKAVEVGLIRGQRRGIDTAVESLAALARRRSVPYAGF